MTNIINKSKENATINKTVKDGTLTIEVCSSKNKTVRPIMTAEARDAIDAMHSSFNCETRSDSIIQFVHSSARAARSSIKLKSEVRQWKLIAWSMTAACVALIATMMITTS